MRPDILKNIIQEVNCPSFTKIISNIKETKKMQKMSRYNEANELIKPLKTEGEVGVLDSSGPAPEAVVSGTTKSKNDAVEGAVEEVKEQQDSPEPDIADAPLDRPVCKM